MLCWGNTVNGQLGLGGIEEERIFKPRELNFDQASSVNEVACSENHSLFVLNGGQVWSCGLNDQGQLGHTKGNKRPELVDSLQQKNIQRVAAGFAHSLALNEWGQVYSWGSNCSGQLGQGNGTTHAWTPKIVKSLATKTVVQIASGLYHSMALTDTGELYTWGSNLHGQLGLGSRSTVVHTPTLVKDLVGIPIAFIACGSYHSFVVSKSGAVFGWGKNTFGQLGLGDKEDRHKPQLLDALEGQKIVFMSCGRDHSAALTVDGGVFTFGAGTYGQLGHGQFSNEFRPRRIMELMGSTVSQIACGRCHTLAYVQSQGRLYAFGLGASGQLGIPGTMNVTTPQLVLEKWTRPTPNTVQDGPIENGATKDVEMAEIAPSAPEKDVRYDETLAVQEIPTTTPTSQINVPDVEMSEENTVAPENGGHYDDAKTVPDFPNGNTDVEMKEVTEAAPENEELYDGAYAVQKIYAGGNQSFALVRPQSENFSPADYRFRDPEARILQLNTQSVKKIKHWLNENLGLEAMELVEKMFQSSSCLNGSCLRADSHFACSPKNNGLDFGELESTFDQLSRVENESVLNAISQTVQNDLIPKFNSTPLHSEALRLFVMLPFYHEAMQPKNLATFQIPLARLLFHVSRDEKNKAVLNTWFQDLPGEHFLRLVNMYKKVVVHILNQLEGKLTTPCHDKNLRCALKMLKELHTRNTKRVKKIGYEKFYIPELNQKLHIKDDYVQWARFGERGDTNGFLFCSYSFLFDAQAKTILLELEQEQLMTKAVREAMADVMSNPMAVRIAKQDLVLELTVSRDNIVEDTITGLFGKDLRRPLFVKFEGEEAEDAGGVKKEFFLLILREIFDPKYGMFKEYEETRSLWFSENAFENDEMFALVGALCGLAIYNSTIINLPFPLVLYKKLLNEPVSLADVADLSPTVYRSLITILEYDGSDFEDVFCLTFDVQQECFGEVSTVTLKEGLEGAPVTQSNKQEYVNLYVDYLLNKSIETQYGFFHRGFHDVCGGKILSLFQSSELMELIVGSENYDWYELQRTAEYRNGYSAYHPTIKLFWEVFHELPLEEKKNFLKFLTGSDRVPVLGVNFNITIQATGGGDAFLPVAHTCFNLLDLPKYQTKEKLRYKLLQAIKCNEGFALA